MTNQEIADRIEKSQDEHHFKSVLSGGEARFSTFLLDRVRVNVPAGFGPVGMAIFIGDESFVRTAAVIAGQNTP